MEELYYPKLVETTDGSKTLYLESIDEHYHSVHGALNESMHVFIKNGLSYLGSKSVSILEVGFGTGLNALLTLRESVEKEIEINYTGIEPYPVNLDIIKELNYVEIPGMSNFKEVYYSWFSNPVCNFENFHLQILKGKVQELELPLHVNCIYYDAFAPNAQNEMWDLEIFSKLFDILANDGILITYCAKGSFKRTLRSAGFKVESIPGPPGKREMVRAVKKPM